MLVHWVKVIWAKDVGSGTADKIVPDKFKQELFVSFDCFMTRNNFHTCYGLAANKLINQYTRKQETIRNQRNNKPINQKTSETSKLKIQLNQLTS